MGKEFFTEVRKTGWSVIKRELLTEEELNCFRIKSNISSPCGTDSGKNEMRASFSTPTTVHLCRIKLHHASLSWSNKQFASAKKQMQTFPIIKTTNNFLTMRNKVFIFSGFFNK